MQLSCSSEPLERSHFLDQKPSRYNLGSFRDPYDNPVNMKFQIRCGFKFLYLKGQLSLKVPVRKSLSPITKWKTFSTNFLYSCILVYRQNVFLQRKPLIVTVGSLLLCDSWHLGTCIQYNQQLNGVQLALLAFKYKIPYFNLYTVGFSSLDFFRNIWPMSNSTAVFTCIGKNCVNILQLFFF